MGKRWTEEENQFLRNNRYEKGDKWCSEGLSERTIWAIQGQASELGIEGKRGRLIKDLTGRFFGGWEVLRKGESYITSKGRYVVRCWCRCKCGAEKLVSASSLVGGDSTSCGNCPLLEIGKIYNEWLEPIERLEDDTGNKSGNHSQRFRVKCHYGAEGCKGEFTVLAQSIKSGATTSCGCLAREKSRERCKEKNPNWRGGITELSHTIRTCGKNLKWKDFCRKRDNYTCQKCGMKKGKLPVHHCRIPFWKMLEELVANGITNVNDIPNDSELWDTNNGVTLCEDCHKEFHCIYKNDFTKEDFNSWMRGF